MLEAFEMGEHRITGDLLHLWKVDDRYARMQECSRGFDVTACN